jgi:hypothetical protein
MKNAVFWDVAPCWSCEPKSAWCHIPEDDILHIINDFPVIPYYTIAPDLSSDVYDSPYQAAYYHNLGASSLNPHWPVTK